VLVRLVDERFFQTMGIPLLEGRLFTRADINGDALVAVVNQTFARRYFAGEDVLGKHVDGTLWKTVVGVAADIRNDGLRNPPRPEIDIPFTDRMRAEGGGVTSNNGLKLLIRSSGDPTVAARELLRSLHEIDPRLVASTSTLASSGTIWALRPSLKPWCSRRLPRSRSSWRRPESTVCCRTWWCCARRKWACA